MSHGKRHRSSSVEGPRPERLGAALRKLPRRRSPLALGSVGLVLGATLMIGGPPVHAAAPGDGVLAVAIAAYAGDAVSATPTQSADAGSDVTYQVTVSNGTSSAQTHVSVPVTLPANFTLQATSITASTGTTAGAGGVLTWSIPSLDGGTSATLSYTEATDAPPTMETDTTSVSVASDQSSTARTATASVEVVPAAEVTISISDGVDAVAPGASDFYTITVADHGPSAVTNATVTDTTNGGFNATAAISSIGGTTYTDFGNGQFQWTGIDLANGASATFVVAGNVSAGLSTGDALVSLATVQLPPGQTDSDAAYNAVDSDAVSGAAGTGPLGIAIAAYPGDAVSTTPTQSAWAGTDVTYQVTVTNTTASPQSTVAVPVSLPANFTLGPASVTPSAGTTSLSGAVLSWSLPSLAAGASATLTLSETTDAPSAMETDTAAASATSDQSAAASTAAASIAVLPVADVTIGVTDGVDTVAPGSTDIYTITVTDNGPSAVTNATVTSTMNGGFTAIAAVSSIGGTTYTDLGGGQFRWAGVNLASGESATFNLMGSVSPSLAAGGAFVNLATVQLPPGQVDTAATSDAVDSDAVIFAPQSIAFTAPASGLVGTSATLSATGGGSGNPVVFSVDPSSGPGVCSVSGTDGATLDFLAPGTCVVDADQAGNGSYAAAPTVSASIAVDEAPAFTQDTPPATGTVGQGYAYTFGASGDPTPAYALAPGAPSWLSLDPASGALSGTPPSGTTSFTYSVVAANSVGSVSAGPFSVAVATPTSSTAADVSVVLACPTSLPLQTVGSCTLTVANAGPAKARYVAAGLALPSSLGRAGATAGGMGFGNGVMWFVGPLPSGASRVLTVSFRARTTGSAEVTAAALSMNPDPNYANNVTTAPITVTGADGTSSAPQTGGRPWVRRR